ncbi:TetR/AcrR family transcriptional regulator [Clostridiaceae bacterium M8S5]|nr:TetR/AcrR family transcriptional regulator [Clostridiaceae bacterium M8S5]
MRVYKKHNERKNEILDATLTLFITNGYQKTTINDILHELNIAKGTFYHYFKSKEDVLNAVVMRFVSTKVAKAEKIASDDTLSIHEKILNIILSLNPPSEVKKHMIDQLHQTSNALMHQKILVEIVKHITPILVSVIEQGIKKKMFTTLYPTETVEFLLVSATFFFDKGLFDFSESKRLKLVDAFINTMETTLGANRGTFSYIREVFD